MANVEVASASICVRFETRLTVPKPINAPSFLLVPWLAGSRCAALAGGPANRANIFSPRFCRVAFIAALAYWRQVIEKSQ
jgi:hypothetical protein